VQTSEPQSSKWKKGLAHSLILSTAFIFSGLNVITQVAIKDFSGYLFQFFRVTGSCLIFLLILTTRGGFPDHITCNEFVWLLLVGIVGVLFQTLGFVLAVQFSNADFVALFVPTTPLFTLLFSLPLGYETLNRFKVIGLFISIGGCAFISVMDLVFDTSEDKNVSIWGLIFILISCAGQGFYAALMPKLKRFNPVFIAFSGMSICTVASGIVTAVMWKDLYENFSITWTQAGAVAYSSLLCTGFSYVAIAWSSQIIDPSVANLYQILQPCITAILAYFTIHETVTLYEIIGGCLTVVGLLLILVGPLLIPSRGLVLQRASSASVSSAHLLWSETGDRTCE